MGVRTLSIAALRTLLAHDAATLYDVNGHARWLQAHVPGAVPLDPDGFGADALPVDRQRLLVFYCSGPMCRKAPLAARRARALGWSRVRVLSAGIHGWRKANLPVQGVAAATRAADLTS